MPYVSASSLLVADRAARLFVAVEPVVEMWVVVRSVGREEMVFCG